MKYLVAIACLFFIVALIEEATSQNVEDRGLLDDLDLGGILGSIGDVIDCTLDNVANLVDENVPPCTQQQQQNAK